MKRVIRSLVRRLGYSLHRADPDPMLAEMRAAHDYLRLNLAKREVWHTCLGALGLHALLRDLLQLHRPNLVVDVGANRGQFARTLRRLGYDGRIISFEPQRALFESLTKNADALWTIIPGAVGDVEEMRDLNVFADDSFSSLHTIAPAGVGEFGSLVTPAKTEPVRVRPLDVWLDEIGCGSAERVLLKTDTQGHDTAVLAGASKTLSRTRVVLTEIALVPIYNQSTSLTDISAQLARHHLVPAGFYPVSHRQADLAAIELDAVFSRAASAP